MVLNVYHQRPSRGRRQVLMQLERQYGFHMSLGSVHRYMQILNIKSKRAGKRKTPKQKEAFPIAHSFSNVLKQQFSQRVLLTDVTYLPSSDGTEYLSAVKSMPDKSIIAYNLSNKNDLDLVMGMLKKLDCHSAAKTILHSDQGSQYTSVAYHQFLEENGLIGSMSRKGTPYDNAPMESFFSILKNEELKQHKGRTKAQTRKLVEEFIVYYNTERPQIGLNKMTPEQFRSHFAT